MFDFSLHFRCLQKATEAFFELSQASLAAGIAWQNRFQDELAESIGNATRGDDWAPMDPLTVWQLWLGPWAAAAAPTRSNAIENVWQAWTSPAANALVAGASSFPSMMSGRAAPWSFYQASLMAMLMNYGVPYSVAAPTARAGTCAMDAADAICAQWRALLSQPGETDGMEYMFPRSAYLH